MENNFKYITTKVGDKGTTKLWSGEKVSKNSNRVNLVGEIDQLLAYVNYCKVLLEGIGICGDWLEGVEKDLMRLMSDVATSKVKELENSISNKDIDFLEQGTEVFSNLIEIPNHWYLPKTTVASVINVTRTQARRCERMSWKNISLGNKYGSVYLNRLSDFLYVLMIYCESEER